MPDPEGKPSERDWRPVPDPTLLTSQALSTAIQTLEDKLEARLEGLRGALEARLDASDKASLLAEQTVTRVPTLLDRATTETRQLMTERFAGIERELKDFSLLRDEKLAAIQRQFGERDARFTMYHDSQREAVQNALLAAEKAVNKQAETFARQIDQLADQVRASTLALDDKINDAKDRLNRIEGQAVGRMDTQQGSHASSGLLISVIAAVIGVLSLLVTLGWHLLGK